MEIQRDIMESFRQWKDSPRRKPILLKGAQQIGKSWTMERFGHECFEHTVKFDFDRQPELISVFETTKEPARLLKELALYCDDPIIPGGSNAPAWQQERILLDFRQKRIGGIRSPMGDRRNSY